jgi:hypothetical protein
MQHSHTWKANSHSASQEIHTKYGYDWLAYQIIHPLNENTWPISFKRLTELRKRRESILKTDQETVEMKWLQGEQLKPKSW